jgi:iron complex outermembrane receptor protein
LGLGLLANYTYVDSAADDGSALPFASKHQVSASPYFERGPFSIRASYTWRSRYFTGVDANSSLYTRAFTQLDASMSYSVDEHLQFSLNASNLLDSSHYSYAQDGHLVRGLYRNGRRMMRSARFKF